jgi:hypothetical protein
MAACRLYGLRGRTWNAGSHLFHERVDYCSEVPGTLVHLSLAGRRSASRQYVVDVPELIEAAEALGGGLEPLYEIGDGTPQ